MPKATIIYTGLMIMEPVKSSSGEIERMRLYVLKSPDHEAHTFSVVALKNGLPIPGWPDVTSHLRGKVGTFFALDGGMAQSGVSIKEVGDLQKFSFRFIVDLESREFHGGNFD